MSDNEPARARAWLRWVVLVILVAAVASFYFFGLQDYFSFEHVRNNVDAFKFIVSEHQLAAIFLFFALYTLMAGLSVPASLIMTLVAGALFGRFLGAGVAVLAATFGATLAFWSSRFLMREWVQARLGQRLGALERGLARDGAFYLFSLRLVPLFPFFVINLAMGLTPIRTWTFFWVSLVGMLPGSFLYANAGSELESLERASDVLSAGVIVSLVMLAAAPWVFRKLLNWRRRASQES
jgi:uncharacterized membrane protein YdjX (TVP38/TMEM64 family)